MNRKDTRKLIASLVLIVTLNVAESCLLGYGAFPFYLDDPADWTSGSCQNGTSQSPIAYYLAPKVTATGGSNPLRMMGPSNTMPTSIKIVNSGHGLVYTMTYADGSSPQITGGPLGTQVYQFVQFHSHWPCEHAPNILIGTCNFETHFVHYNTKYADFNEAKDKPDGLAVVGIMYTASLLSSSPVYMQYTDLLYPYHSEITLTSNLFTYATAMGFTKFPKYITYSGSLTTPPCFESVTWIVVDQLYRINTISLSKARNLLDHDGNTICSNARDPQPINGRTIRVFSD